MKIDTASPDVLRETMIEKVKEMGYAQRPEVERVLRDVPRHEFVPEASPDAAYESLAYLTSRRRENGDQVRWELGAIGPGPAAELAEHLCDEVRAWSVERYHRKPKLTAHPTGAPDSDLHGTVIDKTHSRLVLTYDDNSS